MLSITATQTTEQWEGVHPLPALKAEDNVSWLTRATRALITDFGGTAQAGRLLRVVLLGGTDPVSFRLRIAQAHLRHDLTPSSWSHALLLHPTRPSRLYEISLEPRGGFRYPVPTNGLQLGAVDSYRDPAVYPNLALLGIPAQGQLAWANIDQTLAQFQKQRTSLDAIDLIVRWLAFVWGAGQAGNPLLEGYGIPSSAMLEVVFSSLGHDLTPGLESRSTCPEAIWQAVKWWHEYYGEEGRIQPRCVYRVEHRLVPPVGPKRPAATPKPARPGAAKTTTRRRERTARRS